MIVDPSEIASILSAIGDLLSAIAEFAWPTVALSLAFLFRGSLRDLLGRVRKGKIFGQELELELQELQSQAQMLPPSAGVAGEVSPEAVQYLGEVESRILQLAKDSPRLALMKLSADVERAALILVASVGGLGDVRRGTLAEHLEVLERHGLPQSATRSLRQFRQVRNLIVHGREASTDDILRAIDSGLLILKGIQSVPHERNVVHRSGVPLYADPEGQREFDKGKAVILQTTSAGGALDTLRVFPTTRQYEEGQTVSWEWSFEHQWPQMWYRDPDTGDVRPAWSSSAEFVGRPLDDF